LECNGIEESFKIYSKNSKDTSALLGMTGRFCYLRRVNYYLNRYSVREELITKIPNDNLGIVVVIPCCNEPDLTASLQSLYACAKPICNVEVIVVMIL
jgi:hypothetical protein